jgi:hypothetical protein
MMAYRIVRSPERRVFYIDVGSIPPNEIEQYMQRVMTQMKRSSLVDETSGRVDLRYNPLSVEEDYYIPVRGGTSSKIESLPGGTFTGDIDDVKYLYDKLFAALKIPASYLSRSDGADEDKTTLAQKDVRFARTIQRLQRSIISELEKVGIIHLYTIGFRGDDLLSFKLSLNNPSKIAEMQELEHWKTKFDVAASATEGFFSRRWVAEKLFNLSSEDFLRNQREMYYDRKYDAQLAAVAEAIQEEAAGMAGDFGDDLGGDLDLGGEDFGEEGGEDFETDLEEPGGEEDILLAAPEEELGEGDVYTKPGWDGATHTKKKRDKEAVRRKKSRKVYTKPEAVTATTRRARLPGFDRESIKPGLYEGKETIYNIEDAEEESKILSTKVEVSRLLRTLEKEFNKEDEIQTQ